MNWFYSPDGVERFEVSEEVLLQLIQDGKVRRDMLVWCDGMGDWTPAGQANPSWFVEPPAESAPAAPPAAPAPPEPPLDLAFLQPSVEASPREPAAATVAPPPPTEAAPPPGVPILTASLPDLVPPPPPVEPSPPAAETTLVLPARAMGDDPPALLPPPPPPPPPPPAPAYHPPLMPVESRDSAAMTSVISGSIGLAGAVSGFCCCLGTMIAPVAGLTAVIFGHMAYSKTQGHAEAERDKNLAVVGLVLGYLTIALSIGSVLFQVLVGGLSAMLQHHPFH